ncbi:MAG TPA: hypothetical protein VL974_13850 [Magnetospirillum sp.]|jgi:hypothetical protein|nr:hypothetical protein [Magnetospirillum sp.]
MNRCLACPQKLACRVPRDLHRFNIVAHRLEEERRAPDLRLRLRFFVDNPDCLVEAGFVTH